MEGGTPSTAGVARALAPDLPALTHDDEIAALEAERDRWELFVERAEQALAAAAEQVKAARTREQQLVSRPVVDGDFDALVAVWRPLHDLVVELEARETMLLAHVDALRPQAAQAAMAVREAEDRRDCAMLTAAHHAWAARVAQVQRDFRRAVADGWKSVPPLLRPRVTVPVSGEAYAGYVTRVTELAHEAEALRSWALRHPAWQQGIPEPQTVHPETLLRRMLERGTIDDPDVDPTDDDDGEHVATLTARRVVHPVPTVLPGAVDDEDGDAGADAFGTAEVAGSPAEVQRRGEAPPAPAAGGALDDAETPPAAAPHMARNPLRGLPFAREASAADPAAARGERPAHAAPPPPGAPARPRFPAPGAGWPAPGAGWPAPGAGRPALEADAEEGHRVVVGPRARLGTIPAPAPPVELPRRRRPSARLLAVAAALVVAVPAVALGVRSLRGGSPEPLAPRASTQASAVPQAPPPPPAAPAARTGAALVTTGPGTALLFGGAAAGTPLADTWTLAAGRWTQVPAAAPPPARHGAVLVDDPVRHRVLMVGGVGAGQRPLADMWAWDGSTWAELHPAGRPPAAAGAVGVWDPARAVVDLLVPAAGHLELWTWDGTTWTHVRPARTPSLGAPFAAGFDLPRHALVAVGTVSGRPGPAATWTWDGRRWTVHRVVETPLTLDTQTALAAADGPGGVMLVQRGDAGGQTWRWDGSGWTRLAPAALPHLAAGAGAVAVGGASSPAGPLLLAPASDGAAGGTLAVWSWTGTGWSPV